MTSPRGCGRNCVEREMKGTARQAHAQSARSKQAPAARAQAKMRPGGGNHRRADAHERQAEQVAVRFARGEKGLGDGIMPATPASLLVPGSAGTPLPATLRQSFEASFGADFREVRIHRGGAADFVARQEGAEALTSGGDIFFRSGRFDPESAAGRELLAHELTHVLQQTGRRNTRDELAATRVAGTGNLQRVASIQDDFVARRLFMTAPTLDTVIARHTAENTGDADLATHAATIKTILESGSGTPTPVEQLVAKTEESGFTATPEQLALYFDALKQRGAYAEARKLVKGLPGRTAFGLNDFYTKKLKGDLTWMEGTIAESSLLSKYWRKQFINTFRMHLFGLGRVEQNLGADRAFNEVYEEQMKGAAAPEKLIENERRFYALAALKYVDDLRLLILRTNRQKTRASTEHPVTWRLSLAEWLLTDKKLEEIGADLPEEAKYLWGLILKDIRDVAAQATVFWMRVLDFETARKDQGDFEKLGPVLALLGDLKKLKELKNLERDMLRVAKQVFSLPSGKTPTLAAYKTILAAQADVLRDLAPNYDLKLFGLARDEAKGETVDQARYMELGWVQWILFFIAEYLRKFNPAALPKEATAADQRRREDELVLNRLALARWWWNLAGQLKMDDLQAFLTKVRLGEQEGQKQSELALYGAWEVDEESGLKLMQKEFPKGVIRDAAPLTGADIANFSYMLYASDLAEQIRVILEDEGMAGDFSGVKKPVINEALDRMKKRALPKRYLMKKYVAAVRPADRGRFSELVEEHPLYSSLAAGIGPGETIFIPTDYSTHISAGAIVIWVVPRLAELIQLLASMLPGLDALVRAEMAKSQAAYDAALAKAKKGQEPAPLGAEWLQWMRSLKAVIAATPGYGPNLYDTIVGAYEGAKRDLDKQSRAATSHQRRVLLTQHLTKLWNDYDPADIRTYSKPGEAVQIMLDFAARVAPPRDTPLQMAALLIELGPTLYARLGPQEVLWGALETLGTTRYDLILGLLPHLVGTVGLAADPAKLKDLKSLALLVPQGFDTHLDAIRKLKDQTEKSTIELQLSREMNVNKDSQSISTPSWAYVFYPGVDHAFTIDGNEYQLVEVYESFTFVPSVMIAAGGIDWPESELGDSLLTYAGGIVAKKADRNGRKLFKILRNGDETVVHDNDDRLLAEIMHVVTMQGFVRSMQALQAALETYAEVLMTGAEFIPGLGPPLMAVRIFTSIMAFITGPQFKELRDAFGGDAGQIVEAVIKKVGELFTPDLFWGWLLFGEPSLPSLQSPEATPKQKKVTQRHSKSSAAARLLGLVARLARIGMRLGERIGLMHEKFEYPLRRTEVFVITHPLIATVINLLLENFARLSALSLTDLTTAPELTQKKIVEEVSKLSGKITEMLQTIDELQLPEEVIPLQQLVDIVVSLAVDALPKKYELVSELVKAGLQQIGAWDKIMAAAADQLKAAHVDPNILWRDLIRSELEPTFEALCHDFAQMAGSTLKEIPFLKDLAPPPSPDVSVQMEEGEFPESQELPSEHPMGDAPPLTSWPRSGGTPLDAPLHRDVSSRFGHDFSHVRLHTGPDASTLTRSLGVEGLTTGSHVYLRPGLSPRSGYGARVFRHELSHVIQQTGPRPGAGGHSAQPVTGESGGGVRHDASLEAAADRSAAQADRSAVASAPLDPGSAGARAPQPKLKDIVKKFFGAVSADMPLLERVEDITAGKGGHKGLKLNAYANRVVTELAGSFLPTLSALPKNAFPDHLAPVHDKIIEYVTTNHGSVIRSSMEAIVNRGHEGKPVKTKDKTGKTTSKIEWTLNPSRLEQELEEYVFGLTGLAIDIEFNLEKPAPGAPKVKQIDLTKPFKTFEVKALHLAYVGGTAALWDLVVENTWVKNSPVIAPGTRFKKKADFKDQATAIATYKLNARLMLRNAGPTPMVFMKTMFRFSNLFAKQVEDSIFTVVGGQLDPNAVGPWDDYRNPAQTAANYSSGSGHIHLSFGTYADRKKPGIQWGVARNAHHITQYLMLEYLRNRKSDKPFPHALKYYPGVSGTGKLVNEIENPADNTPIRVGTYEAAGGGMMPTILISEHTHEQGGVHVHGKPDDSADGSSPSTPGFAVHREFLDGLGKYEDIVASLPKLQTVQKQTLKQAVPKGDEVKVGNTVVTLPDLQKAIYRAANKAYHWMRDDMKGKLRKALRVQEVEFYETMIRRQMQAKGVKNYATAAFPAGYAANANHMGAVADAAEKHNKATMEATTKVGFQTSVP
jgi:hypothetical protein